MITVSIHQPSYLVWPPFLEKMARADLFIYLDDVEYSANSEMNRNRVLSNQGPLWLTIPVRASLRTLLREAETADGHWARKHWKSLLNCYSKAPYFDAAARRSLESLYQAQAGERRLLEVNLAFTEWLREQTGITTPVVLSSSLEVRSTGSRRILELCRAAGAGRYLSGPAGLDYLNLEEFERAGVEVLVQRYRHEPYPQQFRLPHFVPHLSALDMLLNLGPACREEILARGEWVPAGAACAAAGGSQGGRL
jgi:hypothetical protein